MATDLSFITVCKARLQYLKQTLPLLASQSDVESIVVDYGCPQGTRQWVREHYPRVKIVAVDDDSGLCVARGRNLGAMAATTARLCFIDADIRVRDGFVSWVRQNWRPHHYFRALPPDRDIWGTMVCPANDFSSIGGYDEAFRGWGGEDDDLYMRLEDIGCRPSGFPAELIEPIRHDDAERVAFYDIKDKWTSHRASHVYIAAKTDLTRILGRPLSLEERKHLFAESQIGVSAIPVGASTAVLEISLPSDLRIPSPPEWALEHKIVYRFLNRSG